MVSRISPINCLCFMLSMMRALHLLFSLITYILFFFFWVPSQLCYRHWYQTWEWNEPFWNHWWKCKCKKIYLKWYRIVMHWSDTAKMIHWYALLLTFLLVLLCNCLLKQESNHKRTDRSVLCFLRKAQAGKSWPRLTKETARVSWSNIKLSNLNC